MTQAQTARDDTVGNPQDHLDALRHANDGWAITVWKDGSWKVWRPLDAKYAESDPAWLVTLPGATIERDRAALSARPAQGERVDWRPIESAPKQQVILMWAITDESIGNWKMASGHWQPGYGDEPGVWYWDGRALKSYDVQPTHWMPLPSTPAIPSASAKRSTP